MNYKRLLKPESIAVIGVSRPSLPFEQTWCPTPWPNVFRQVWVAP